MFSSSPIPRYSVGYTFVIAISLIGIVALGEAGALAWSLLHKSGAGGLATLAVTDEDARQLAEAADQQAAPDLLPKPTPVPQLNQDTNSEARISELVEQARILRDRGDTSTALIHLREGLAISPSSPMVLSELAITFEKMGMADKALEQWRRIYDMGDTAGIYYAAADAKIKNLDLLSRPLQTPAAPPVQKPVEGIQAGSVLGLLDITSDEGDDPADAKKLTIKIPLKGRPETDIDPHQVAIQVYFYDKMDDQSIVRTNANVNSRWATSPVEWTGGNIEVLEVEYEQPKLSPKIKENRKYYGYIVRVYYKGELQDMRADPVALLKQYPPPLTLTPDSE